MDFRQTFFLLLDHYLVNYSGEIQGYNIRLTPVVDCLFSSHVYWIKYGYFKEMKYVSQGWLIAVLQKTFCDRILIILSLFQFSALYLGSLALVILGVIVYNLKPTPSHPSSTVTQFPSYRQLEEDSQQTDDNSSSSSCCCQELQTGQVDTDNV